MTFDWVLFGGSFDPPHLGHLAIVDELLSLTDVKKCFVVPAFQPPQSCNSVKQISTSFANRVLMTKSLFSNSKFKDRVLVLDIEKNLSSPSYTRKTLQEIQNQYSGKGALIMGSDQFAVFHNWYEPRQILEQFSIFVVGRDKDDVALQMAKLKKNLSLDLKVKGDVGFLEAWGTTIQSLVSVSDASSTLIRSSPKNFAKWLNEDVLKIIKEKNLYRGDE